VGASACCGVVLGGDAGGGFLSEPYVEPEAAQVGVAGFGLQLGSGASGSGQVGQRRVPQLGQGPPDAMRVEARPDTLQNVAAGLICGFR
jgi:hypothetical protein